MQHLIQQVAVSRKLTFEEGLIGIQLLRDGLAYGIECDHGCLIFNNNAKIGIFSEVLPLYTVFSYL